MSRHVSYKKVTAEESGNYFLQYEMQWDQTVSADNGDVYIPKQWKYEEGDPSIKSISDYPEQN